MLVSIISSCREEPPLIYFNLYSVSDSTYTINNIPSAQPRNSLMEDYTGVRCANCPNAHDAAKNLSNSNNGRMNILSIHPTDNPLGKPYTNFTGYQDFTLKEGAELMSIFGTDKNLPSIGLDRIINNSKKKFLTNSVNNWTTTLVNQLSIKTPLNIDIENSIVSTNDSVRITCYITATEQVKDSVYLSLIMLEDKIVNPQENSLAEIDTFYVHDNVARGFITSHYGTYLKTNFTTGKVYRKQLTVPLLSNWNKDNCKILAFVHRKVDTKSNCEIWHSQTKKIK